MLKGHILLYSNELNNKMQCFAKLYPRKPSWHTVSRDVRALRAPHPVLRWGGSRGAHIRGLCPRAWMPQWGSRALNCVSGSCRRKRLRNRRWSQRCLRCSSPYSIVWTSCRRWQETPKKSVITRKKRSPHTRMYEGSNTCFWLSLLNTTHSNQNIVFCWQQ